MELPCITPVISSKAYINMGFLSLQNWLGLKRDQLYTHLVRRDFGSLGRLSLISPPFRSDNPMNVFIGNVRINAGSWLDTIPAYGSVEYKPRLEIGNRTYIGYRAHIIACGEMKIGSDVVIADGVYISDNLHGFEEIDQSIIDQSLKHPGTVTIEDEVWLGERVCVLPNVTIGKHAVIGSNSVVTKDIPAYSIAVGIPARVIKKRNLQTGKWETV